MTNVLKFPVEDPDRIIRMLWSKVRIDGDAQAAVVRATMTIVMNQVGQRYGSAYNELHARVEQFLLKVLKQGFSADQYLCAWGAASMRAVR